MNSFPLNPLQLTFRLLLSHKQYLRALINFFTSNNNRIIKRFLYASFSLLLIEPWLIGSCSAANIDFWASGCNNIIYHQTDHSGSHIESKCDLLDGETYYSSIAEYAGNSVSSSSDISKAMLYIHGEVVSLDTKVSNLPDFKDKIIFPGKVTNVPLAFKMYLLNNGNLGSMNLKLEGDITLQINKGGTMDFKDPTSFEKDILYKNFHHFNSLNTDPVIEGQIIVNGENVSVDVWPRMGFDMHSGDSGQIVAKIDFFVPYDVEAKSSSGVLPIQKIGKIPLGGKKEVLQKDNSDFYQIYVPTRDGGDLTISAEHGKLELYYPDRNTKIANQNQVISYSVPEGNYGWYYVKHIGSKPDSISNAFVQEGRALKTPWNFWWYPMNPRVNPLENYYGDGGVFEKYDYVLKTTAAKQYEIDHNSLSTVGWGGHCWGGALVSILLSPPKGLSSDGIQFTQEDIEGLLTKLANTSDTFGISLFESVPKERELFIPSPAVENADKFVEAFHSVLVNKLKKESRLLLSDLGDPNGKDPLAIWNHAVYSFRSEMYEALGGDEKVIDIETTLFSNFDLIYPSDTDDRRIDKYSYVVEYSAGNINPISSKQNWISSKNKFLPRFLWQIDSNDFVPKKSDMNNYNQHVTKDNLKSLGLIF